MPHFWGQVHFLHDAHGFVDFKLNHDLFTVDRKKVMDVCKHLIDRHYTWSCSARVDCVDPDLLAYMYAAGCRSIYFGIETGSKRMQAISEKRLNLDLVDPILDVCDRIGIATTTSFIIGYPDEISEDQVATLDMVGRHINRSGAKVTAQLHLLTPEPGTKLMAQHFDKLKFDAYLTDFNFPRLDEEDDRLLCRHASIFSNHFYYQSEVPRARNVFLSSAWRVLVVLGRDVITKLLERHWSTLGRGMLDFFDWYCARSTHESQPNASDLLTYVADRFGIDDRVCFLVRYAIALQTLRTHAHREGGTTSGQEGVEGPMMDPSFKFADRARLIRHTRARVLTKEQDDSPSDVLLIASPANHPEVREYILSPKGAELLETFREPLTYLAVCRVIEASGGDLFPDLDDIFYLVKIGALELFEPSVGVTYYGNGVPKV